jgi:hypothetical protein
MSAPATVQDIIVASDAFIRRRRQLNVLFISARRMRNVTVLSLLVAAIAAPLWTPYSPLLPFGMALSIWVGCHMLLASRRVPWIPGIIATMACLQWIVAPWLNYVLQESVAIPPMPLDAQTYFEYFVPATFVMVGGLYLPLLRAVGPMRDARGMDGSNATSRTLRPMFDFMLFGGVILRVVVGPLMPGSLRYASTVIDHLMYVGAFGRIIMRAPGWWWRLGLVLGVEFVMNAIDAQFADSLIWTLLSALLLIYSFRLRAPSALGLALLGLVGLFAINGFKSGFRDTIREEGIEEGDRPGLALTGVASYASTPSRLLSMQNVGLNVARLNEGWVAGRVLIWVPYREPFARGETVLRAIEGAIVPRFLDPNKVVAGGRDNIPRFAGLTLINNTSMNLSIPGEMYANYGFIGGLFGTFVLAFVLGTVFRIFVRWGRTTPLAYVWAPYLLFGALSAEMGIFEVIGTLGKTATIATLIIFGTRTWRNLLPLRTRRLLSPSESAVRGHY